MHFLSSAGISTHVCAMLGLLFATAPFQQAGGEEPERVITKITGDLYRFQNAAHYSVFLVTSEGIIATDPINADAAHWLKSELQRRFDRPVKYLIYSHHHYDHISGGEVFADTATIVAHDRTRSAITANAIPTAPPGLTFKKALTIELGGQEVRLIYVGKNHTDNSTVMLFPEERVLFAVDFIPVKVMPWRTLGDGYFPDWIESIRRVEELDFDILAPGHDDLGNKSDVRVTRHYFEDLYGDVKAAMKAGQSLEEMQASITLEAYRDWPRYEEFRAMNIEGMHRILSE